MSIRLEKINKHYGQQVVVNQVSLEVDDGEFFVLLGASGSGKTTVLNIIAGIIQPESGSVFLHEREVTHLSTQRRNVGFVFQSYALFQYMTVSENITFGLKVRKIPKAKRLEKSDELLEMVGLVGMGNRMPSQLSGGQQQRVALARALALDPDVLLLDEPLGALDAKIRVELRRSLKTIQRKSGVAAILVTHDQEEAFDLGDRIGVMNFGRLIEVGTPHDLYQHPRTEYVASFLGSANLMLGEVRERQVHLGANSFPLPDETSPMIQSDRAQILFRPEDVALAESAEALGCFPLGAGTVVERGFNGPDERLRVSLSAIPGVRAISPPVPFGHPGIMLDVARSPEQSTTFPIQAGHQEWVGIRRLHVISHPGMNFLLVSDGSLRTLSAVSLGGYMARMAHARMVLLGIGQVQEKIEEHLQDIRKQLGSGMASLALQASAAPFKEAVKSAIESHPIDLAIMGWRPTAGVTQPEAILDAGDHHLLLATEPLSRIKKALICLASGEPGKDTVVFAGRLLRHIGADAALLTVVSEKLKNQFPINRVERFLEAGKNSLARFGVQAKTMVKSGDVLTVIQEEVSQEGYDLVILGAPLPNSAGSTDMGGVFGEILTNVNHCSFLIVQSRHAQRLKNQFRRKS